MSKARLAYETLHALAVELGVQIVEEGLGGRHRFVVFEARGQRRKFFYPSTPSDVRGHLNMRCDARKLIRSLLQ